MLKHRLSKAMCDICVTVIDEMKCNKKMTNVTLKIAKPAEQLFLDFLLSHLKHAYT